MLLVTFLSLSSPAVTAVPALSRLAPSLHAQQPVLTAGRVVRVRGPDTLGLPGARVVLHRVGRSVQGPVDSTIAGPHGEFRFRFRPDSAAVYLLSSGYAGLEYFSTPVHAEPSRPDTGLLLIVSDTSSTAPLRVASRHIVIGKPGKDGVRSALEIVVLENDGPEARVPAGLDGPVWGARLPAGVVNFQIGQADVSPDAIVLRHDSLVLLAPVAPGEKQLLYTYQLPAQPGPVRLPVGDSVGAMNVMLEEFDRRVAGSGITKADSQRIEGRVFQQWTGPAAPGSVITIDFPGGSSRWLLPLLVGAVGVALLVTAILAVRRRPATGGGTGAPDLIEQIARLDARYQGREPEMPAAEWAAYQGERARLKQALATELADRTPAP